MPGIYRIAAGKKDKKYDVAADFRTGSSNFPLISFLLESIFCLHTLSSGENQFTHNSNFVIDQDVESKFLFLARNYMLKFLGISGNLNFIDEEVTVNNGDIYFCADFFRDGVIEAAKTDLFKYFKARNVKLYFMIYDILPILKPEFFPPGANLMHEAWLKSVANIADKVVCISKTVSQEVAAWYNENISDNNKNLKVCYVHLGAKIPYLPNNRKKGQVNNASILVRKRIII